MVVIDGEPHRNRTCNLLIKSLSAHMKTSIFSYKKVKSGYMWKWHFEANIFHKIKVVVAN